MSLQKTIWIINQYASTPATGMSGRHYNFARGLAQQGHKVYLVCAGYHHLFRQMPNLTQDLTIEPYDGFNMVWVKMPKYDNAHSKKRILNWFLFSQRLRKLADKIIDKPDVVLYSSPSLIAYLGAQKLAKKFSAKLIFEVRDIWPLSLVELGGFSEKHPFIRYLQWIENKAYRESDVVISNLKNSVQHMQSHGLQANKFHWIPNGFSMAEVEQTQALNPLAIEQLPKDKFVVGYTGTLGVANALDTFIEAAELLKEQHEIAFVIVGNGREKQNLMDLSARKQLNNTYFVDAIPKIEIQSMLQQFDVCYIGLTKDPLFRFGVSPNKLFDYLYSAKPIIYAIDSGAYKPVTEAVAGYDIEPGNPQAIVDAVLKLYHTSLAEREQMGINGRQVAMQSYEYLSLSKQLADVCFHD